MAHVFMRRRSTGEIYAAHITDDGVVNRCQGPLRPEDFELYYTEESEWLHDHQDEFDILPLGEDLDVETEASA